MTTGSGTGHQPTLPLAPGHPLQPVQPPHTAAPVAQPPMQQAPAAAAAMQPVIPVMMAPGSPAKTIPGRSAIPADTTLLEGETALEGLRPTWRAFVGAWLTGAGLACAAMVVFVLAIGRGGDAIGFAVFGLLMLAMAGLVTVMPIIRLAGSHYLLTDRRIIQRFDLWVHNESTVWYERVQNVKVSQGIIERLFDAGSVYIETAAGGSSPEENLRWVHHPRELRSRLVHLIEAARGSGDRSLGDRPNGGGPAAPTGPDQTTLLTAMVDELRAIRQLVEQPASPEPSPGAPPPSPPASPPEAA